MAQVARDMVFTIAILDTNNIIPFSKPEGADLSDELKYMDQVLAEVSNFSTILQRNLRRKLINLGEDKSDGAHVLRYFFDGTEGLLELIIDRPAALNAYFVKKRDAVTFLHALRATFEKILPKTNVKSLFIDSIHISYGLEEKITHHTHSKMRAIYLHRGVSLVVVALFIVGLFEVIKAFVGIIAIQVFSVSQVNAWIFTIIAAVIISFFFEPIKKRTEKVVEKLF